MHTLSIPLTTDIRITRHAVEQLLIRFPEDRLPRDPGAYLRQLIQCAAPAPHHIARRYRAHPGSPAARTFTAGRWILVLIPNRHAPHSWTLVTVTRTSAAETNVPRALRENRLRDHEAFQTGHATALLRDLAAEARTTDPRALERMWYERQHPLVLHGGYDTFAAFCRAALSTPQPAPAALVHAPTARRLDYDSAMRPKVMIP
jgi:hypothetical protein